jgi:hypothetical protein
MGCPLGSQDSIPAVLAFALFFSVGCTPGDSERCGDGFTYRDGMCQPVGDTDTSVDSDAHQDGGADGGDLPTGMGEVCTGDEDCAGYEADYCLMEYGADEGVCTVQNCSVDPGDCPDGYLCCDFTIPEVPNFCATDEQYADLGSMCAE